MYIINCSPTTSCQRISTQVYTTWNFWRPTSVPVYSRAGLSNAQMLKNQRVQKWERGVEVKGGEKKEMRGRGSKSGYRRITEGLQNKAWIIFLEPLTSCTWTCFICFHKNIIRLLIGKLQIFPRSWWAEMFRNIIFVISAIIFDVTSVQFMQISYSNLCTASNVPACNHVSHLSQPEPEHTYHR